MSITLRQLTYDLLNTVRGGKISDDEALSERLVQFWIKNTRAQLIREDINKGHSISSNVIQSLGCVDVELVDASLCCGIEVDCNVFRTTVTIPTPIEAYQKDLITRVGPIMVGSRAFDIVPIERIPFLGYTPFKGINEAIRASILNKYVYIFVPKHNKLIKKINIMGVWADPTELSTFNECSGSACYTDESNYPISEHMVERMKSLIIQTDLKVAASAPSDSEGNAKFDVKPNV